MTSRVGLAVVVAVVLRLLLIAATAREVADVARYRAVARHVLDVSWNPYQAPRLYPYPPAWVWAEAGSEAVARATGWPFPVLVKLPVLAADVALVALLGTVSVPLAWAWALHPVALLVGAVHGQFDALALVLVLAAVLDLRHGRADRSALALAGAIALKSFPVLLLPPLALAAGGRRAALRYALLATVPVGATLVPFVLHDPGAVRRELLGYGGIADFGWIGLVRGVQWRLGGGELEPSPAHRWPVLIAVSKVLFLGAWAAFVGLLAAGRVAPRPARHTQGVLLGFLALYGAISAQYLLWAVPLGLLVLPRSWSAVYAAAASLALLGFYGHFVPVLLWGNGARLVSRNVAGSAWVAGVALVEATLLAGLVLLARDRDAAEPAG